MEIIREKCEVVVDKVFFFFTKFTFPKFEIEEKTPHILLKLWQVKGTKK
jgi:hypothetical protein